MKRLAIVTTHPIQYYAPVFKLLSETGEIKVKVFYTWGKEALNKYDPGFRKKIEWDIPLLEGYDHTFLRNVSKKPGSGHFNGIINPDLNHEINQFGPDAILVYGWAYNSHIKAMRHFKGKIPIWFRGDSHLLNKNSIGLKGLMRNILLTWVYKHVDKCFYVGSANKKYFLRYGVKEQNLVFAPHAIDNSRFSIKRIAEVEALRSSLGIQKADILILFAGKLEDVKVPELLLQAFLAIKPNNAHLLFVGNGSLEQKLKDISAYEKNVHFMPFQNQQSMPVIYQSADIYCLPSKSETWGLAVNEAMVCGNAIVVSDKVGCAQDLVKEAQNGFIFVSGDQDDLQKTLIKILRSPKKLKEMGEKSRMIIEDWNFNAFVTAIKSIFNDAQ